MRPGKSRAALIVLACFVIGVALMIPFEEWYTRLLGVSFLLGSIVGGAFVIAEPGFLSGDDE